LEVDGECGKNSWKSLFNEVWCQSARETSLCIYVFHYGELKRLPFFIILKSEQMFGFLNRK
jgi:hypothetical protein